ncbi:MAG: hypothetical protein GQ570_14275 [Helicobacteraceae bacterium]|nr:hypothetical protein [Helicobacteraceae bacterium]
MNTRTQLFKYAIVGGGSTAIHLSTAYAYIYFVANSLFISNLVGFSVAYIFSYVVQSRVVFRHSLGLKKALKYLAVQLISLVLALVSSAYILEYNTYIKTLAIVFIIPLITFVIHKLWTFR